MSYTWRGQLPSNVPRNLPHLRPEIGKYNLLNLKVLFGYRSQKVSVFVVSLGIDSTELLCAEVGVWNIENVCIIFQLIVISINT